MPHKDLATRKRYLREYRSKNPDTRKGRKKTVAQNAAYNERVRLNTILIGSRRQARKHGHADITASLPELIEWRRRQPALCAICQASGLHPLDAKPSGVTERRLAVDHCHDTGALRGLLCAYRNHVLGLYETPAWREALDNYRKRAA